MIRIARNRRDAFGQDISPSQGWFKLSCSSRIQVIARVGKGGFDADVYGADTVRSALCELFHDKCGYCEYPLARTDVNVEHYRPKSRVSEAPDHPGYYWFVYDWRNLLPSCTFCNQKRRDLAAWPATTKAPAAGKADSFPLVDENRRAYYPSDDFSREEPLLVNPTVDEPSLHITFDPLGSPVAKSRKGDVSIAVYNLDTHRLNEQRRRVITEVIRLLKIRSKAKESEVQPIGRQILACVDALKSSSSAPYAAAARAVIKNPSAFGL